MYRSFPIATVWQGVQYYEDEIVIAYSVQTAITHHVLLYFFQSAEQKSEQKHSPQNIFIGNKGVFLRFLK